MNVRPFRTADTDTLYDICLRTGDSGADATSLYDDPRLLGHLYLGAYLELAPEFAFILDDGEPAGYVIGALDTRAFEAACERSWWPSLREQYPRDLYPSGSRDDAAVQKLHNPPVTDPKLVAEFPSHLHIDLLPRVQGRGAGRLAMEHLFTALRAANSPGVHLGVGARNTGAIAFYERIGFLTWADHGTHRIMTHRL